MYRFNVKKKKKSVLPAVAPHSALKAQHNSRKLQLGKSEGSITCGEKVHFPRYQTFQHRENIKNTMGNVTG